MASKTKIALVVVLVALFGGLGMFMFDNPFAEAQGLNEIQKSIDIPEIDQNQAQEEISKTIRVTIEDGITTSDNIR